MEVELAAGSVTTHVIVAAGSYSFILVDLPDPAMDMADAASTSDVEEYDEGDEDTWSGTGYFLAHRYREWLWFVAYPLLSRGEALPSVMSSAFGVELGYGPSPFVAELRQAMRSAFANDVFPGIGIGSCGQDDYNGLSCLEVACLSNFACRCVKAGRNASCTG